MIRINLLIFLNTLLVHSKFVCKSGHDLDISKVCNGLPDCPDSSDERKELCAMSICDINEFKCYYGACISRDLVCNNAKNCVDNSDEVQCGLTASSCNKDQFRCGTGECINATLICNSEKNCADNSDESNIICEHELCPSNTFRCRYGNCIKMEATCNGFYDCIDGSDEVIELCSHKNISCPSIISTRLQVRCENDNGIVPCEGFIKPGTRAIYSCRDYFKPKFSFNLFNNESTCQENGVWSRDILKCEPECGRTNKVIPLIVKGTETKAPFPWHATMYVHKNGNFSFWCGASLISEALFITAAHCTFKLSPEMIRLALGKYKKNFEITPEETEAVIYQVKQIIQHPLYMDQNGNYASDIALLEISGVVQFNEYRMPVCIDWELNDITSHLSENSLGVVMGMGLTENDTFSESLRLTWLPVIPNDKCIEKHKTDFKKYVTFTSFCAGWANGTGVCNGDSGGGLAFLMKGIERWCLEGIVSLSPRRQTSSFCDPNEYTIFTKVGIYVKWIQHVIEEVHATHNFTRKKYEPILESL